MKTILLSRTDKIGDVILTLPMAGMIRKYFPSYRVLFLARGYALAVAKKSTDIAQVYDWDKVKSGEEILPHVDYFIHVFPDIALARLAKRMKIKHRIGTSHRFYHWWTCNRLVNFSRRRSDLHESQLNMKLLQPLGITEIPDFWEMHQLTGWKSSAKTDLHVLLPDKFKLIFHMKSMGSAKEWASHNFLKLAHELPKEKFQIYISGTSREGGAIKEEVPELFTLANVTDVTGRFDLNEFISFIEQCDGLLACSTGPLHIAAVAGLKTLGLYSAERPIHAGRWAPIGSAVQVLSEQATCSKSLLNINVPEVKKIILQWKMTNQ